LFWFSIAMKGGGKSILLCCPILQDFIGLFISS
jgi:hypothetical protein